MKEIKIEDYMALIKSQAWKYAKAFSCDYDDTLSSSFFAFVKAKSLFEEEESSKESFYSYFMSICRTQIMDDLFYDNAWEKKIEQFKTIASYMQSAPAKQEDVLHFDNLICNLSPDSQAICQMIFREPHKFVGRPPKSIRGEIVNSLRIMKWGWDRIWKSFSEIKGSLSQVTE